MSFLSPDRLWLLVAVAALAAGYILLQRQRKTYAARLASAHMLDGVLPNRPGWRRHGVTAVFLAALISLVTAFAQPATEREVPRERATVIVAIDVSLSMAAADVDPSRIIAAQAAANRFVDELPPTLNVGIVSFAGQASVLVPPTTDRAAAHRAIDRLQLAESTAIGEAIFTSLDALAAAPGADESGDIPPARIVLLSDGETTVGRPDVEAVDQAVADGVQVSTIAFGTTEGTIVFDDPTTPEVEQQVFNVPVRHDNLQAIADATGGSFFAAENLSELEAVYEDIGSAIGYETELGEVTEWFVGGGLVLLLVSSVLSAWWFQRLI